jgi:hypothetical protein
MKQLESLNKFANDAINIENVAFFGGELQETGDEKLNAESGQPQDLYDTERKRYIFFE